MGTVPSDLPTGGEVPETYQALSVAPDNRRVAVWSAQVGIDFVDFNVAVHDMETGDLIVRFNEHSLSGVNRANCPCPLFGAFLAAEAAVGVPQNQLDSYDYSVIVEGTGIGEPTLVWSATGTLIATYGFDVAVSPGGFNLGRAPFAFELDVTTPSGGLPQIVSRNAGVAPFSPMPDNDFSIHPVATRTLPTGPAVIHYGKRPVAFWPWPLKWLPPRWFSAWRLRAAYRTAKLAMGFVG